MIKKGVYRHFKNKYYRVKGTALNALTDKVEVLYSPLYKNSTYNLYTREIDDFNADLNSIGKVNFDQKLRFECINHKAYLFNRIEQRGDVYVNESTKYIDAFIGISAELKQMDACFYFRYPRKPKEDIIYTELAFMGNAYIRIFLDENQGYLSCELLDEIKKTITDRVKQEEIKKYIESIYNNSILVFDDFPDK